MCNPILNRSKWFPPVNISLLNHLRESPGYIPLDLLKQQWPEAEYDLLELERFGFRFLRHPYLGVAFAAGAPRLCPDQIESELGTRWIGRRIAVWDRVTSTNDLAANAARSLANGGLVILAESQTAGRGRRGRSWTAPPASSILASVLVFPPPVVANVSWLTALGAVALVEAVEFELGNTLAIKWPNDVRFQGRKLAGVLVERRGPAAVIGIGVNVNVSEEEFPAELREQATSLQRIAGRRFDRSEIARRIIQRLDTHYDEAMRESSHLLNQGWRNRLEPLGRAVRLLTKGGMLCGQLIDADLEAGIVVDSNGSVCRVGHDQILAFEESTDPQEQRAVAEASDHLATS